MDVSDVVFGFRSIPPLTRVGVYFLEWRVMPFDVAVRCELTVYPLLLSKWSGVGVCVTVTTRW